jgi:hypothetical protein
MRKDFSISDLTSVINILKPNEALIFINGGEMATGRFWLCLPLSIAARSSRRRYGRICTRHCSGNVANEGENLGSHGSLQVSGYKYY